VKQALGIGVGHAHRFSCEINDRKRDFLLRVMPGMERLFSDAKTLAKGNQKQAPWDFVAGEPREVPGVNDITCGFPCTDVSKLNSNQLRNCIRNAEARTGGVFAALCEYIAEHVDVPEIVDKHSSGFSMDIVEIVTAENVLGLAIPPKLDECQESQHVHSNLDYAVHALESLGFHVLVFELDPRMFTHPVARPRLYLVG